MLVHHEAGFRTAHLTERRKAAVGGIEAGREGSITTTWGGNADGRRETKHEGVTPREDRRLLSLRRREAKDRENLSMKTLGEGHVRQRDTSRSGAPCTRRARS